MARRLQIRSWCVEAEPNLRREESEARRGRGEDEASPRRGRVEAVAIPT